MSALKRMVRYIHQTQCHLRLFRPTSLRKYGHGAAGTLLVHCASKNENKSSTMEHPDVSRLSHEHLIKHACTETVNSACQLLTCTVVALVDIGQKYRKALEDQMSLMEESLRNIGNDAMQDDLTDLITIARSNVDLFRRSFLELDSLMEYVEKLVNSATETSYLAGAETACTVLGERLHSAKIMVNEQKELIKKLEDELTQLQKAVIDSSCGLTNKGDR